MTTFRNDSKNRRGILLSGGVYAFLKPGEVKTVPSHQIKSVPNGLIECDPSGDPLLAPPPADMVSRFDRDGDGREGGSLPHDPPALSGMTKAQLTEQAGKEGVDVAAITGTGQGGKVTNGDIAKAIEAKRAEANGGS